MPEQDQKETPRPRKFTRKFDKIAAKVSEIVGSPLWFAFSILIILIWLPLGFVLDFSEIWHLYINSLTTILTFLMMSLLHASQNRWERKMERRQQREGSEIKQIKEEIVGEENEGEKVESIR